MLTARGDHMIGLLVLNWVPMIIWQNHFILRTVGASQSLFFRRVQPIQERGDTQPKLKICCQNVIAIRTTACRNEQWNFSNGNGV